MNIRKHLYLFAGLLTLPIAANAASITINVPLELTNVPAGITQVSVVCRVGVGPGTRIAGNSTWSADTHIGTKGATVTVPANRNYRDTLRIEVTALPLPGKSIDAATHYACQLLQPIGQPALRGLNEVSGAIPR